MEMENRLSPNRLDSQVHAHMSRNPQGYRTIYYLRNDSKLGTVPICDQCCRQSQALGRFWTMSTLMHWPHVCGNYVSLSPRQVSALSASVG
jgi:hypothetical protein